MAFPDPSALLQGFGFRHSSDSGFQIKPSANGNCVFIFGWEMSTVRLWYSVFLVECLDITLYYIAVCKVSSVLGTGASTAGTTGAAAHPVETVPAPAGGGTGATAVAAKPDEQWMVTYHRKATEESCSFGSAKDVTHADLQNLFNTKMGLPLPPPPSPN